MANPEQKRSTRVAEMIRAELMSILLTGELHDPGANGALVSNVILSGDLRIAKIYLRLLAAEVTPARQRATLKAFERAKGFLRRELGMRVQLKHTPELRFFWDDAFDDAVHMESLLSEFRTDGAGDGVRDGGSDDGEEE